MVSGNKPSQPTLKRGRKAPRVALFHRRLCFLGRAITSRHGLKRGFLKGVKLVWRRRNRPKKFLYHLRLEFSRLKVAFHFSCRVSETFPKASKPLVFIQRISSPRFAASKREKTSQKPFLVFEKRDSKRIYPLSLLKKETSLVFSALKAFSERCHEGLKDLSLGEGKKPEKLSFSEGKKLTSKEFLKVFSKKGLFRKDLMFKTKIKPKASDFSFKIFRKDSFEERLSPEKDRFPFYERENLTIKPFENHSHPFLGENYQTSTKDVLFSSSTLVYRSAVSSSSVVEKRKEIKIKNPELERRLFKEKETPGFKDLSPREAKLWAEALFEPLMKRWRQELERRGYLHVRFP